VSFRDAAYQRARRAGKRIVLPEGDDPRVQEAARRLEREGLGVVEVLGRPLPPSPIPGLIRQLRARRPGEVGEQPFERAHLDLGIGNRLLDERHALGEREERLLRRVDGHGDDNAVREGVRATDQVFVAARDRVERPGIDRDAGTGHGA